jgi:hypothetical protein
VLVQRARKIERFLSQPFHVAEQFTGTAGTYVPIGETVRSFREILDGKHDDLPEGAFLLKGSIDDVVAAAGGGEGKDDEKKDSDDSDDSDDEETKAESEDDSKDEDSDDSDDESKDDSDEEKKDS